LRLCLLGLGMVAEEGRVEEGAGREGGVWSGLMMWEVLSEVAWVLLSL